jgi:hypothetical protein
MENTANEKIFEQKTEVSLTITEKKPRGICSNFSIMILIGLVISVLRNISDPRKYKNESEATRVILVGGRFLWKTPQKRKYLNKKRRSETVY